MRTYWIRLVVSYRWYAAGLLLVAGFAAWFGLAVVDQIRVVTDSIIAYQQGKPVSPTQPIIAFFFYKLGHHGMYFLNRLLDIRYKPRLLSQLVRDAYTQTVGHSLHWFESQLSGDVASKVADFQDGCMTILTAGFRALASVSAVGLSVVFLWRIHPVPAITLGVFIPFICPCWRYSWRISLNFSTAMFRLANKPWALLPIASLTFFHSRPLAIWPAIFSQD
jgi:ATP-binding cassette subfamily B protein